MIEFGTDGWRGVISDNFTFNNVRIVAQAIAGYLNHSKKEGSKSVVVGYDRRFLSKEFAQTVSCVLAANEIKVILSSSDIPTPVVSFHTLYGGCDLGVMITASHNPAKFNGLKIKTPDGGAADKVLTDKIEKRLRVNKLRSMAFPEAVKKRLVNVKHLDKGYIKFLRGFVDIKAIRKMNLKVLIDNMYGCGDEFAQRIVESTRIKIDYLHNSFNPSFGGCRPEPVQGNLRELVRKVKTGRYNLGVALDGDADRIAVVNEDGEFINAQVLLPLLAIHMVKNRKEHLGIGKTVVGSNLIDEVACALGVPCYETAVGFKYISNLFRERLISIGGEEAGGIGFSGYIPERDGTASLLMLLEMMAIEGKNFDGLLRGLWKKYGKWQYMRTSFPVRGLEKSFTSSNKHHHNSPGEFAALRFPAKLFGKRVERINKSDGIKLITKDNWLMFRKSGTEPIIRVYAQARSRKELGALIDLGKKVINSY